MLSVLVGGVLVGVPVVFAFRVLFALTRQLGALDASRIAAAISVDSSISLESWQGTIARMSERSSSARLLEAVTGAPTFVNGEAISRRGRQVRATVALAEQVSDLERELAANVRVPRVAASLSSTTGLLAATFVMRRGLGTVLVGAPGAGIQAVQGVIEQGLTIAAIAVLGGLTCAALHRASQKERRLRLSELDDLSSAIVERLEATDKDTTQAEQHDGEATFGSP